MFDSKNKELEKKIRSSSFLRENMNRNSINIDLWLQESLKIFGFSTDEFDIEPGHIAVETLRDLLQFDTKWIYSACLYSLTCNCNISPAENRILFKN